jgi:hypothetical protein
MPCRILVIGDLHFSSRSLPLLEQLKSKIIAEIKKRKLNGTLDHVVFLGDTHDRFGQINSSRSKEVIEFFYQISLHIPFTLLIGNHDIPNKTFYFCEDHGFTALKYYWNNVTVVDKCVEFEINGFIFRAVAYCPNGRLIEGLSSLDNSIEDGVPKTINKEKLSKCSAVFCHQEIHGCDLGTLNSTEGDKWDPSFPLLICGHIHKYHYSQDNVLYIGSPYQDNFGEDPDKSISLFTFNEDGTYTEERIYLDLPKKIRLRFNYKEYIKWQPDPNTLYSITVTGTWKECSSIRDSEKSKKMRIGGNKIEFITTSMLDDDDMGSDNHVEVRSFKTVVAASIQDKDHLRSIYQRVFEK